MLMNLLFLLNLIMKFLVNTKKRHIIEHNFNKIKYVNNTFNCENNSLL